MAIPDENIADTEDADNASTQQLSSSDAIASGKELLKNMSSYTAQNDKYLSFVSNPLSTTPKYENLAADQVQYLPISYLTTGDNVSIYKTYTDLNGGSLKDGDKVSIQVHLIGLKAGTKITYIDQLKGPRTIPSDSQGKISGLSFSGDNVQQASISQSPNNAYEIIVDNLLLNANQKAIITYSAYYNAPEISTIRIDTSTDTSYPSIIIESKDACLKDKQSLQNTHDK
jgi:hypothetical protein